MSKPKSAHSRPGIVTLADLAPRRDIVGGAGKRVFGAAPVEASSAEHSHSFEADDGRATGERSNRSKRRDHDHGHES